MGDAARKRIEPTNDEMTCTAHQNDPPSCGYCRAAGCWRRGLLFPNHPEVIEIRGPYGTMTFEPDDNLDFG